MIETAVIKLLDLLVQYWQKSKWGQTFTFDISCQKLSSNSAGEPPNQLWAVRTHDLALFFPSILLY